MIWLTWRQERFEALLLALTLAAGAAVLIWTGTQVWGSFDHLGVAPCLTGLGGGSCTDTISSFTVESASQQQVLSWLAYLPTFLGVLLAAPIVLEIEDGSHRLVWTQSVTRVRWVATRAGLPLVVGAVGVALIAFLGSWAMQPTDRVVGPMHPGPFDLQGTVPVAYMVVAFAVTLFVGVIWRRALAGLGTGITAGIALHFAIQQWLRPHLMAPVTKLWVGGPAPFKPQDWLLSGGETQVYDYVNARGQHFSLDQVTGLCGQATGQNKGAWGACLRAHRLGELIQYQPADRFWAFQTLESLIVLAIAVTLLASSAWWLVKKTS